MGLSIPNRLMPEATASPPQWKNETRKVGDLRDWPKNPRQLSKHDYDALKASIERFGLADPLIVNADDTLIGGHQRKRVLLMARMLGNGDEVDVRVPDRVLSEREVEELNIRLNRAHGAFDFDLLADRYEVDDLLDWGFTEIELQIQGMMDENAAGGAGFSENSANGWEPTEYAVIVECETETAQTELLERLADEGYECRALTS